MKSRLKKRRLRKLMNLGVKPYSSTESKRVRLITKGTIMPELINKPKKKNHHIVGSTSGVFFNPETGVYGIGNSYGEHSFNGSSNFGIEGSVLDVGYYTYDPFNPPKVRVVKKK